MDDQSKNDLPLMSNTNDILVKHYIFDFQCHFENKTFSSSEILFLYPVNKNKQIYCDTCRPNRNSLSKLVVSSDKDTLNFGTISHSKDHATCLYNGPSKTMHNFIFILDCNKILVTKVEELDMLIEEVEMLKFSSSKPKLKTIMMNYVVDEWSLKIWKDGAGCPFCFPRMIKITFTTVPEGLSLLWVKDQDHRQAVFTYGAWINNRSLFPCQEPPSAMATWEATTSLSDTSAIVLMSGDKEAVVSQSDGMTHYYYFTRSALPLSTLALAIGYWKIHKIFNPHIDWKAPSCRIIASQSLLSKSVKVFSNYLMECVMSAESFLGPYPFPRIDLLVVPRGFGSLGMASPNIIFASQTLLSGHGSMCSRISHEVSHGWFGLLIGALDWTEEWLSEGFATFMEDHVHVKALHLSESDGNEFCEIKSYLRLLTLKAEVQNTSTELQVLRINKGETVKCTVDDVEAVIVKDGQNPCKSFLQVHYIKGYFLLKYLCDMIGVHQFMHFLSRYVEKFKGQLVESWALFEMFAEQYPDVSMTWSIKDLFDKWLHSPGVPQEIEDLKPSSTNKLFTSSLIQLERFNAANASFLRKNRAKRRKINMDDFSDASQITPEQKILVLEGLLEESKLAPQIIKFLLQNYCTDENAEVLHRLCELIVKHRFKAGYTILESFMKNDLAMGVYIYGEMLYSGNEALENLAKDCYSSLQSEMEPNFINTIEEMFQSSEKM